MGTSLVSRNGSTENLHSCFGAVGKHQGDDGEIGVFVIDFENFPNEDGNQAADVGYSLKRLDCKEMSRCVCVFVCDCASM